MRAILLETILSVYRLDPAGIHGVSHWARVEAFGLRLADETGADPLVVSLFALFHDACRVSEGHDPRHGPRGALLANRLLRNFPISDIQMNQLLRACELHTYGTPRTLQDITILTCWDADRLDLGRVGVTPDPRQLCTEPAKSEEIIAWAVAKSEAGWNPF
ncbi:MAG: HD domain-containing protein [Desulfovibrionales bacterium]